MRIEYHRKLIADHVRNAAFYAALKSAIVPGETTVADIGTGTGLIGMMAARLGAKRVYMYETAAVGAVAERAVRANKLGRICEVIAAHSTEMIDPPRVDVVVSETLGNYALEENIVDTLNDAVARHLKPGGELIPRALAQFVSPVVTDRLYRELSVWDEPARRLGVPIDLAVAQEMSANNVYVRSLSPSDLLAAGAASLAWDTLDFAKRPSANRRNEVAWRLDDRADVYGFALWWTAQLGDGIELTTAPGARKTHWEQLYFPLSEPVAGAAGDHIRLALRSKSSEAAGTHLAWTVVHADSNNVQKMRRSHDLDKGYLP